MFRWVSRVLGFRNVPPLAPVAPAASLPQLMSKARTAWDAAEDARLAAAVAKHGAPTKMVAPKWRNVAADVGGGRTPAACLGRWMTHGCSDVTRGGWTPEEDAALLAMFTDPATPSWATRAVALGERFHGGRRRGGSETIVRYFALLKNGGVAPTPRKQSAPAAAKPKPTASAKSKTAKAKPKAAKKAPVARRKPGSN